jgi:hypothetical protein
MTQQTGESYPRLREVLGEDAFAELAQLIRKTYEANEARRRRRTRRGSAPAGGGAGVVADVNPRDSGPPGQAAEDS